MASAREHPEVVQTYLQEELTQGRIGVVTPYPHIAKICHISPFGVIPKKSKPWKWRLILDLSSPSAHSINDGIAKESAGLSYVSIDDVTTCILQVGRGAILTKIDIKHAYRNVPVHPEDRCLLGMAWKNEILIDKVLPFGFRSAPIIFSAVADGLQWVIQRRGIQHLFHYLDDFITIGPARSKVCENNLGTIISTCACLGVPLETEKREGPATVITFLGLELDTMAFTIRLPVDKLRRLRGLLGTWSNRKAIQKRDLLSLIGYLQHAAKAVRQGRTFVRRLIDLSMATHHLESFVRLNTASRSDLAWWGMFAEQWNGVSFLHNYSKTNPQVHVCSDASSCGAYCLQEWFQLEWPQSSSNRNFISRNDPHRYGGSSMRPQIARSLGAFPHR